HTFVLLSDSYISFFQHSSRVSRYPSRCSFFFFQCSRDHRHLHSFPTRRSSDLSKPRNPRIGLKWCPPFSTRTGSPFPWKRRAPRSEEHTSELQSRENLVCRLLLEKKKKEEETTHNQTRLDLRVANSVTTETSRR